MVNLSHRSHEEELMDDLQCEGQVVEQTLRELEVINKWLGGNHVTLSGIKRLIKSAPGTHYTIVDIGCGSGDILQQIARWGRAQDYQLKLIGVDANPAIITLAQEHCQGYPEISFEVMNIFSDEFQVLKYDILTATLFTHHFSQHELVGLISRCNNTARLGVVINDIHRHWAAYYSIKWLTRIFSRSAMVRNDAALSVARAFKRKELHQILKLCGIDRYTLRWMWAFRWQLVMGKQ